MPLRPHHAQPAATILLTLLGLVVPVVGAPPTNPLVRAHSHNDYEQRRPLHEALDHGFCSVEADIHLVDGALLVAHDRPKVSPARTLESLYLEPLRHRIHTNQGHVFPQPQAPARAGASRMDRTAGKELEFILLIDIKSEADATYAVLRPILESYRAILTRFTPDSTRPGPVTVILSGNRPIDVVRAEPERWCAIDGRLPDLETADNLHLMPLISSPWSRDFGAFKDGALVAGDRQRLAAIAGRAHARNRMLRFWGVPDEPFAWRTLLGAGVDWIGTDHIAGLATFLAE